MGSVADPKIIVCFLSIASREKPERRCSDDAVENRLLLMTDTLSDLLELLQDTKQVTFSSKHGA